MVSIIILGGLLYGRWDVFRVILTAWILHRLTALAIGVLLTAGLIFLSLSLIQVIRSGLGL